MGGCGESTMVHVRSGVDHVTVSMMAIGPRLDSSMSVVYVVQDGVVNVRK